ncbi:hypothetical protein B0T09DRAFT_176395 [Sordaria sp. MPI-SDFR-AT-0083]|nr:hypothetical protein B0T09DRAFT_176395 [Sordaria sp. MPI-SDFR-AT-0083]
MRIISSTAVVLKVLIVNNAHSRDVSRSSEPSYECLILIGGRTTRLEMFIQTFVLASIIARSCTPLGLCRKVRELVVVGQSAFSPERTPDLHDLQSLYFIPRQSKQLSSIYCGKLSRNFQDTADARIPS